MKQSEMSGRLRKEMACVRVSPELRRKTLAAMREKETKTMKRKISVALVAALVIVAMCAVALAAVNRAGMLDFIGRYSNTYIPDDAQNYVQTDVAAIAGYGVKVNVRECYYDGHTLRLTADITPQSGTLLLGADSMPEDSWQDLISLTYDEMDHDDTRTILDVYSQGGYEQMYGVSMNLTYVDGDHGDRMLDFVLNPEDGVLTYYMQASYSESLPQREVELTVCLTPYEGLETGEPVRNAEGRMTASTTLTVEASKLQSAEPVGDGVVENAYVNTEPVEYESIGVCIDCVLIEVEPQEIYYTIDWTVTDPEKFALTDGGLFFEFVDPDSTAEEPWDQLLADGLSGIGSVVPLDGDEEGDLASATHYRQNGTLGRSELYETYTVRAYECWEKARFDTHEIEMRPATEADIASSDSN